MAAMFELDNVNVVNLLLIWRPWFPINTMVSPKAAQHYIVGVSIEKATRRRQPPPAPLPPFPTPDLFNYDHFANVPPTALVKITRSIFNVNAWVNRNKAHYKILVRILDVRIFNTDRHAGNLLVRKLDGVGNFGQVELIPIDHGLSLPETLEDHYFEWIHWPQASIPFSDDELDYIRKLDPVRDSEMLRRELPMTLEDCLQVHNFPKGSC
ncbi:hypothetical protein Pint_18960 [Pistacia integerrima]|uniref:Uncharacterized protein n=1 Tax=Pistacia integerrima TaxID=434235 RepID=A0ACC0YUN8_9ROSI|nr:hypothetical protein Pint_18960 [Pistacia integerrima]